MTRDIIELNNFLVLIEHSVSTETTVNRCELAEWAIGFAFYGSGEVSLHIKSGDGDVQYKNTSGIAISFAGRNLEFYHTISPDRPLQTVTVFCTLKNVQNLPAIEAAPYHENLPHLIHPKEDFVRGPEFLMNPDMTQAVAKIFSSTYTGSTRLLFLKSQVTELLSHFFANVASGQAIPINEQDRQKLYDAKKILSDNIVAPPSLNELSKMIGLNSYKLKKNFKELFGIPVFKHLQNERLLKAHDLLKQSQLGIQEAAWQVGYESVSSFSNAFQQKFGFRPSEIKK